MLKKYQIFSFIFLSLTCLSVSALTVVNIQAYEPNPNDYYPNDYLFLRIWKAKNHITSTKAMQDGSVYQDGKYNQAVVCENNGDYTVLEVDIFHGRPISTYLPELDRQIYCLQTYYRAPSEFYGFSTMIKDNPGCYVEADPLEAGKSSLLPENHYQPIYIRATKECEYTGPCLDNIAYNYNDRDKAETEDFKKYCLPVYSYPLPDKKGHG